jgi:hypothetical protein
MSIVSLSTPRQSCVIARQFGADHLRLKPDVDREELEELKRHVAPEAVPGKLDDLDD